MNNMKLRLIVMNFLQIGLWGAYLTSMGRYLGNIGLGSNIGWFYSMQGIVSLFMPAIVGIIADRWVPAQKMLGICHIISASLMALTGYYGYLHGASTSFAPFFTLYSLAVAFYMPTLAISNSVAYNALDKSGLDTVRDFPPIRMFGTVGFICCMWFVDLMGFQSNQNQFYVAAFLGLLLGLYSFSLPACPIDRAKKTKSVVDALGLRAFKLFSQKKMAIFFIFSMLLGVSLQITNGFANPFLFHFANSPAYADTFGVNHANILISLSQMSETFCILLIPFVMKHFGIKRVMLIAMFAWVFRFGLFGLGNPGSGVWMFVLSMIVYGVAFDFFNISGSLFVDKETDKNLRSSAQGLFFLMTNGIGATIGTLGAQAVVNTFTHPLTVGNNTYTVGEWSIVWFIFAGYALIVGILFALIFRYKTAPEQVRK